MQDCRIKFEIESRLINKKREILQQNINHISKKILKRLSLNPMYDNVTMNHVKKIINDNFITTESISASNSIVMQNFKQIRQGVVVPIIDADETDADTVKGTE